MGGGGRGWGDFNRSLLPLCGTKHCALDEMRALRRFTNQLVSVVGADYASMRDVRRRVDGEQLSTLVNRRCAQ